MVLILFCPIGFHRICLARRAADNHSCLVEVGEKTQTFLTAPLGRGGISLNLTGLSRSLNQTGRSLQTTVEFLEPKVIRNHWQNVPKTYR